MSDEAAFLAAITSNPADDLPRLVYADWLDERSDPRAEYLRLIVEVATRIGQGRAHRRLAAQIHRRAGGFELGWREGVGKRFSLMLDSYSLKIPAIIGVRQMTGRGLAESKFLVENTPSLALQGITLEEAVRVRREIESGCGRVRRGDSCCKISIRVWDGVNVPEPARPW